MGRRLRGEHTPVALIIIEVVGMCSGDEETGQTELVGFVLVEDAIIGFALVRAAVPLGTVGVG